MDAQKDEWVMIHKIVLESSRRPSQIPKDTHKVPLEMWVKGFIKTSANIGQEVEVRTPAGRDVRGTLVQVNPYYGHDFGKCVPELLKIGLQAKAIIMQGEDRHDE